MSAGDLQDLGGVPMLELFRAEAETQKAVLNEGLLALERDPSDVGRLEAMMRAAHSFKGAARIVEIQPAVAVAHVMEDCFVAAQRGHVDVQDPETRQRMIDLMLRGVDLLDRIASLSEMERATRQSDIDRETSDFQAAVASLTQTAAKAAHLAPVAGEEFPDSPTASGSAGAAAAATDPGPVMVSPSRDRALRITADNLNQLLALAGEVQVEARRLKPFGDALLRLKRQLADVTQSLDGVRESLDALTLDEQTRARLLHTQRKLADSRQQLAGHLAELDTLDRRAAGLTQRLYHQALACRMRPFADATRGLSRVVRDLARSLGKESRLEVLGADTPVDRDILEIIESQLAQLLRNAVDHGIETPEARHQAGKPPVGTIWLEARHSGGQLLVTCGDDGRGIDVEALRTAIVFHGLTPAGTAEKLSANELFEFLFLPGFTMKPTVTEISGRGVGLDVVQTLAKAVRGNVRVESQPGQGTRFELHLPLTLSVMSALLVEIAGEPYAFPLASIRRTLHVPREQVAQQNGCSEMVFETKPMRVVTARQLFHKPGQPQTSEEWSVVVLGTREHSFGLVVDRFLGGQELVVHPLDPRVGKMMDLSAAGILEDGTPVLIVDTDDLVRSIEKMLEVGTPSGVPADGGEILAPRRKRVLVVDDSLTVRELERKVLSADGYEVELGVDGMDAWNAVRMRRFDLMITDVDMPRLSGYELTRLVKSDASLRDLPVMMVSYKDREEDRLRGLAVGADYYLAKSRFQEQTFLDAVHELIGEAVG